MGSQVPLVLTSPAHVSKSQHGGKVMGLNKPLEYDSILIKIGSRLFYTKTIVGLCVENQV